VMKIFGPDYSDGLALLRPYLDIEFVTGDKRGYSIRRFNFPVHTLQSRFAST